MNITPPTASLLAITLVLLARWILLPETAPVRAPRAILLAAIQAAIGALLCLSTRSHPLLLLAALPLALAPLVLIPLEKRADSPGWRLATLLLAIAPHIPLVILVALQKSAQPSINLLSPGSTPLLCLAGALLCLKESNYMVRAILLRVKNTSKPETPGILSAATDNGRIIGSLERLLVYILLLTGQPLAVTAVVAVKALARFKRMETDQSFAEYVVIAPSSPCYSPACSPRVSAPS